MTRHYLVSVPDMALSRNLVVNHADGVTEAWTGLRLDCAAYKSTPSRHCLISLIMRKIARSAVEITIRLPNFMDGRFGLQKILFTTLIENRQTKREPTPR